MHAVDTQRLFAEAELSLSLLFGLCLAEAGFSNGEEVWAICVPGFVSCSMANGAIFFVLPSVDQGVDAAHRSRCKDSISTVHHVVDLDRDKRRRLSIDRLVRAANGMQVRDFSCWILPSNGPLDLALSNTRRAVRKSRWRLCTLSIQTWSKVMSMSAEFTRIESDPRGDWNSMAWKRLKRDVWWHPRWWLIWHF